MIPSPCKLCSLVASSGTGATNPQAARDVFKPWSWRPQTLPELIPCRTENETQPQLHPEPPAPGLTQLLPLPWLQYQNQMIFKGPFHPKLFSPKPLSHPQLAPEQEPHLVPLGGSLSWLQSPLPGRFWCCRTALTITKIKRGFIGNVHCTREKWLQLALREPGPSSC